MRQFGFGLLIPGLFFSAANVAGPKQVEHEFDFGARPRYVDVSENELDGRAASALFRLSLQSEWTRKFSTVFEYDHVETWYRDDHSDGVRFNGQPLVADVPGGEINQALLRWEGRQLELLLGRQRIELANQRFVGSASYWQNDQTYDALRAKYQFLTMSSLQYIYIDKVHTYLGDDAGDALHPGDTIYGESDGERPAAARGNQQQNTHLIHLELREWDFSRVLAWYYRIDNETAPRLSNNTFGVGYRFRYQADVLKYLVEADLAQQDQTFFSDNSIPYYRLETGVGIQSIQIMLSREKLGSESNWGFITPLASVNDFQGWADRFILTPDAGIIDTRLQFDWRFNPFRLDMRYHFFEAAESGMDFGTEFDLDIIWKPASEHKVSLRFADFKSDYPDYSDRRSLSLTWTYKL